MIKSLKIKILIGFMMVVLFLIIAGGYSIYQFILLNKSADTLVEESYITLSSLKTMRESIENENDAILMLMLGKWEEGKTKLRKADSSFMKSFKNAEMHSIIPEKDTYLKNIANSYTHYKDNWNQPIVETERQGDIDWYFSEVHTHFLNATRSLDELTNQTQLNMYNEARQIKDNSKRAIIPGLVAIISAVVYLLMLNFLITKSVILPIERINKAVKNYSFGSKSFSAKINSNDELKDLEQSIRHMTDLISNQLDN
jgi:methyl-accepting chemotaxis protein